jgi:hypothetical protein
MTSDASWLAESRARDLLDRAAPRAAFQRRDRAAERHPERLPHADMADVEAVMAAARHDGVVPAEVRRLPSGAVLVRNERPPIRRTSFARG